MKKEESASNVSKSHLTVKEVAARWGVSQNYVRRLIWDGKLAHTKFGRAVRIPVSAVEGFAAMNTVGGETQE